MKNTFRWIGILEGLSFLALLGVAMPLKYVFGMPEATRVPGMVHGLLFVAYVMLALGLAKDDELVEAAVSVRAPRQRPALRDVRV